MESKSPPTNVSPAGGLESGDVEETRVRSASGVELYLRWAPGVAPVKGAVLVTHGVGEHGGRYEHLETALTKAGWSVYIYDHRGHGRSGGRRVHVTRFDDYVDDLQRVFQEVQSRSGGGKVFVYGHSMGGLVVTTWAALRRPTVWGVIIAAPPFKLAVQVPMVKILAAKTLSKVTPTLALANEVDPAFLSRDAAVGRAYLLDTLVERKATVRWGAEFLSAIDRINARGQEIDVPYLLLHGEGDRITDVQGTRDFHLKASSEDKTIRTYPGLFHELHNEMDPERTGVFRDLLGWLEKRR